MSMKTNFQKVQEFNRAFDMVCNDPKTYSDSIMNKINSPLYDAYKYMRPELFRNSKNIINLRLNLIIEEVNELNYAVEENDIIEIRDALSDILYVVYGMADVLGIDIDAVFGELISKYNTDDEIKNIANSSNYNKVKIALTNSPDTFLDINDYKSFEKMHILSFVRMNINNMVNILKCRCNFYCDTDILPTRNNMMKIANDIVVILKLVYCYSIISDINADNDFNIVHISNMSKLCSTIDDAEKTVADYIDKYNKGISPYDSPYYYELPALGKWIVKNKSTGKALKNINYQKVNFNTTI